LERIAIVARVVGQFSGVIDIGWRCVRASVAPVLSAALLATFMTAAGLAAVAGWLLRMNRTLAGVGAVPAMTDPAVRSSARIREPTTRRVAPRPVAWRTGLGDTAYARRRGTRAGGRCALRRGDRVVIPADRDRAVGLRETTCASAATRAAHGFDRGHAAVHGADGFRSPLDASRRR
jgi:hypothetical protein